MGIAGVIVLYIALKFLAIWSVFSGLALGASVLIATRFSGRSGNALPPPHGVASAAFIFALQVFGSGVTTLVLGSMLSGHIDDGKGLNALTGGFFLLVCSLLAQRQVCKVFRLSFWQPRLLKVPLGVASQILLIMLFFAGSWLSAQVWPERYEHQRTIRPENPFSKQMQDIQLRPSNVRLSIPSNHISSVREDYLPRYLQTFSSRMQTEVTVEFLFPNYAIRTQGNDSVFRNYANRDRLSIRIKPSAVRQGLSLKKEWEIQTGLDTNSSPAVEAGQSAVEAGGSRHNVLITHDEATQLTLYSAEGRIWKWYASGEHVIRCLAHASSVPLIGQPCDVEHHLPNGVDLVYSFPLSRLAQWQEIDSFTRSTFAGYAKTSQIP